MVDLRLFRSPPLNDQGQQAVDRIAETFEQTLAILEALGVDGPELVCAKLDLVKACDAAKRSVARKPENVRRAR